MGRAAASSPVRSRARLAPYAAPGRGGPISSEPQIYGPDWTVPCSVAALARTRTADFRPAIQHHRICPDWDKIQVLVTTFVTHWPWYSAIDEGPDMSKAERLPPAGDTLKAAGMEFTPQHMVEKRMLEIIADLDANKKTIAAAYVQMALDLVRCAPIVKD